MAKRVTVRTLLAMKQRQEHIAMMTAYDYPTASLLDEAGMHVLLVGDSLGMVVQGNDTTIPVTLQDIAYHTKLVARAVKSAMVVSDLPFLSYQASPEQAMLSAARIMQEGGCHAVKLEGGQDLAPTVRRLVDAGIPVMGHIGLTPQSVHALGGFSVQGKTAAGTARLIADAEALQQAGAFAVVLEMIPAEVALWIRERLTIPVIGIGAGPGCDGQVLVFHDFFGLTSGYIPKHNKRYADAAQLLRDAATQYIEEVQTGVFPGEPQTAHLEEEVLHTIQSLRKGGPSPT